MEPGQTWQDYLDKYCPNSPPPPTTGTIIPTFPNAPIIPTRMSSIKLMLPPAIPVV